jgi:hypothetical protein
VHSLIDNTFLECGDLGLHKIISLHESRYSQIEQHIHAIYISRRAPRITLSHCYLFVLADPAVVDQGGDCHTLQACMLPLWRETFSKAHHRGSGYAGTGVIAKYSRHGKIYSSTVCRGICGIRRFYTTRCWTDAKSKD